MLKVTTPIRVSLVLACLLFMSFVAFAQAQDWHLSNDGARALFARSAFAHGYMHGYEEGFHVGDLDLQMGRTFHEIKGQEKFKKPCGYHSEFGQKGSFESGYRKGYSVGYIDAYTGRSFRAMQLVRQAKSQHWPDLEAIPDGHFDRAFVSGYEAGRKFGLQDGRTEAKPASLDSVACGPGATHSNAVAPQYCAAYENGYHLGYSDGYDNQREAAQVFARK
ncbi:MAG: hypothetical protein ACXVZX_05935 [Terriglobales bacterium]